MGKVKVGRFQKYSVIILVGFLALSFIFQAGCLNEKPRETLSPPLPTTMPAEKEDQILVQVYVLKDQPKDKFAYELMNGTPNEASVFKFYLKRPELPGSGTFEKLDVITLQKIDNDVYYGEKFIQKINETLCVGYSPVNFIDGKSCVEIDPTKEKVNVTVHYWETKIGMLGG